MFQDAENLSEGVQAIQAPQALQALQALQAPQALQAVEETEQEVVSVCLLFLLDHQSKLWTATKCAKIIALTKVTS